MFLEISHDSNLVIICGPVATGKTTLANKILRASPKRRKAQISFSDYQDVIDDVIGTKAVPNDKGINFTHDVGKLCKDNNLVVCDGCYLDKENLASFLGRMRVLQGKHLSITLIKMFVSKPDLRREFALGRPGGAPSMLLERQENNIFTEVVVTDFQTLFPWVQCEHLILDPRNIEIKFL